MLIKSNIYFFLNEWSVIGPTRNKVEENVNFLGVIPLHPFTRMGAVGRGWGLWTFLAKTKFCEIIENFRENRKIVFRKRL